ncbi:hypothetical protein AXG93_948s1060 [Marchantia polymorpha subsp. ruderalis]|uniref:Uncharacterized protein n=1 Tax=Marchantia polymorpha subsp. ruderalis TaxID=1480154 RepID=A0A176VHS9_MARPO|nr:hypothetical protein AXG93_948s1060 [Marchantia polymorpha subsp. ruderalis]
MKTLPEDPELPTDEEGAPDVELGLGDKDPPRTRRHPIEEERSPALADRCFQSGFHGTCPGLTKLLRRWWMSIWGRYWNKNRVSHEITRTTPVRFSRTSASSRLVQSRITTLAPFGRGLFQAPYLSTFCTSSWDEAKEMKVGYLRPVTGCTTPFKWLSLNLPYSNRGLTQVLSNGYEIVELQTTMHSGMSSAMKFL